MSANMTRRYRLLRVGDSIIASECVCRHGQRWHSSIGHLARVAYIQRLRPDLEAGR
jgi:hypothetical protein